MRAMDVFPYATALIATSALIVFYTRPSFVKAHLQRLSPIYEYAENIGLRIKAEGIKGILSSKTYRYVEEVELTTVDEDFESEDENGNVRTYKRLVEKEMPKFVLRPIDLLDQPDQEFASADEFSSESAASGTLTSLPLDVETPTAGAKTYVFDEALEEKRRAVAEELLQTEKNYCSDLVVLAEVYRTPLMAGVDNDRDVTQLFNLVGVISAYNHHFYDELKQRIEHWHTDSPNLIGEAFLMPLVYRSYTNNFDSAREQIQKCSKSPKYKKAVDEIMKNARSGNLDPMSQIIKPIQRIPRYVLLLQELSKKTPSMHPDSKFLAEALEKMKAVADDVNASKGIFESQIEVSRIQLEVQGTDNLLQPTRRFVSENVLETSILKKSDKSSPAVSPDNMQLRKVVLFNDAILVAKPKKSSAFTAKSKKDLFKQVEFIFLKDMQAQPNGGNMVLLTGEIGSILFRFKTDEEAEAWTKAVQDETRFLLQKIGTLKQHE